MTKSECDRDLVEGLSKLEGVVSSLVTQIEKIDAKLDPIKTTCQRFEDYREARKDLPEKVEDLARKTATCQSNCQHHTAKDEEYYKKTDYLMMWSYRISGAQILISIIAAAIVILVQLKLI